MAELPRAPERTGGVEDLIIRRATSDDVPDMLSRAVDAYPPFDVAGAAVWLHLNMENPTVGMFVGGGAVAIAMWHTTFFWPEKRLGRLGFLYAHDNHPAAPYRCLAKAVDWAREQGCVEFVFDAITGIDLSVFAKRLGAESDALYRVRLNNE